MSQPMAPPTLIFGQGPPVVLLHAFPLDGRIWRDHAQALAKDYRVLVPDLRGFGAAADQTENLAEIPIDLVADDIAALLDREGLERVVLGGISRGGYVALAFARKYPQRLRGLMLFDTRANPADEKERQFYAALADRLKSEGIEAAVEMMGNRLFSPHTVTRNPELIARVNAIIRSQTVAAVAAGGIGMTHRLDALPFLPGISVPTLAMAGEDDAALSNTRAIAAAIPQARFLEVAEAGHLSILEQPDFVIAAMRDFLGGISE